MEKRKVRLGNLMTKFSHAVWILKYYGSYYDCEKLMKWMCQKSRVVWEVIHKSLINNGRRDLSYLKPFDKDISDFLLPEKYKNYTLSVIVDSIDSGQALMEFIESVPDFYQLRFRRVLWELEEESPKYLTALYNRLVMLDCPDNVFVNNHQRFIYEYLSYDTLKGYVIPYIDHLEKIEETKYAKKIGSLEVCQLDIELGKLKPLKVPINEFIFRDRDTLDLIFNRPLKFEPEMANAVTSLYFREVPLAWVALGVSALAKFCKNLTSYRAFFKKTSDFSMGLFENVQKMQGKYHCTSISLNFEDHHEPTIVKSFMKIAYKEGRNIKVIHTSKAFIQLSDKQEEVIHHTPEYIMLSSLNKCRFNDVKIVNEHESSIFKSLSKHKLDLRDRCFVILNGYFDEVSINGYDSITAINPYGCCFLNICIDEEMRGLRWLKFCNFFRRVSIFTKLKLTLRMEEKIFSNLFEVLNVICEMEVTEVEIDTEKFVFKQMRNRDKDKFKELILNLPKLKQFKDMEETIRCVDSYQGKKKVEYQLNNLLGLFNDVETEDHFMDHMVITSNQN